MNFTFMSNADLTKKPRLTISLGIIRIVEAFYSNKQDYYVDL